MTLHRCDLGIALFTNSDPTFYSQPAEPVPDYPEQVVLSFGDSIFPSEYMELVQGLDEGLAEVCRITRKFCLLANLGSQTGMTIQFATISGTMTAVMYRLARMSFAAGSPDKTVQLGLLAFTHHIFLQWREIRLPRHHLSQTFRNYLQVHSLEDTVPSPVMLWLLMTAAASLLSISEEPWFGAYLVRQIKKCHVKVWKDLEDILKSFMWIPLLDEKVGKHTYDFLTE